MEIKLEKIDSSILHIQIIGNLDLYNSEALKKCFIQNRLENKTLFIFNLKQVDYIDSTGIGCLINIYSSSKKRNLYIRFIYFQEKVLKIFQLTGLVRFLPVSKSLVDAIDELKREARTYLESKPIKKLLINDRSPLFQKSEMHFQEFHIGFDQVRKLASLIAQSAPIEIQEINLLEQQISEIIKNAVKHGNKMDKSKGIRIWYSFSTQHAHLIVEDEGHGFKKLEEWNQFYRNKIECHRRQDNKKVLKYLSFRTEESDENDGGNALFAAIEYWNDGVVFNKKKNCIAVKRTFR